MKITTVDTLAPIPRNFAYLEYAAPTPKEAEKKFRAAYPHYDPAEAWFLNAPSRQVLFVPFDVRRV